MTLSSGTEADALALLEARLDALERRQADQDARFALLEAGRGRFAAADVRLLLAIDEAAEGLPFRAGSILLLAEAVPELRVALLAAFIETGQELGKLFARLAGHSIGGVRLERVKLARGGWWWSTVRTDHQCNG